MQPLQSATVSFWVQLTSVYQELIDTLVEVGYEVRRDLFGAPYDWRLAADGLEQVCHFYQAVSHCCFAGQLRCWS